MKALIDLLLSLFGITRKKVDKKAMKEYIAEVKETKAVAKAPPVLPIEFKTKRVAKEFKTLAGKNPILHQAIIEANEFTSKEFKKPLTITMIFRTDDEQDYLYRNNARYKKKKFKSPHQFWHGVDLRSRVFTDQEVKRIEGFLNHRLNPRNYYRWSAKNHTVGHGMHFHIQFARKQK